MNDIHGDCLPTPQEEARIAAYLSGPEMTNEALRLALYSAKLGRRRTWWAEAALANPVLLLSQLVEPSLALLAEEVRNLPPRTPSGHAVVSNGREYLLVCVRERR